MRGIQGSDRGKCSPLVKASWLKQSTGKPSGGRIDRFHCGEF